MGNLLENHDEQLTQSLKREYLMESHPYLLHRTSNQLCTLHKVTTNSLPSSNRMQEIIDQYQRTKCESISKLHAHYKVQKNGYCSDEETYYFIFQGQNTYTLKEEFVKRRFYQTPFRQDEIMQIVETNLCGLREYTQRFQRQYQKIALDSLIIDQPTRRIYLRDPWLNPYSDQQNTNNLTAIMQSYPSPQKLNALKTPNAPDFSQFLSNLFSVGVICLELKHLDFADNIYNKKREVQYPQIANRIGQFRDQKLRRGLQLLLSPEPATRKQIFSIWGIQNRDQHYLVPLIDQKQPKESHRFQPQPIDGSKLRGDSNANSHLFKDTEVNPRHIESIYIPSLPLDNLNSNRTTTPIIKLNTARTSTETQRVTQFNISPAQTTHYYTTRPLEKPTNLFNFNTHSLAVSRQEPPKYPLALQPVKRIQQSNSYFNSNQQQMQNLNNRTQMIPQHLAKTQQNVVKFSREQSPPNFAIPPKNLSNNTQSRPISPLNARQSSTQQNTLFANIKESYTYYQLSPLPPSEKQAQEKKHSQEYQLSQGKKLTENLLEKIQVKEVPKNVFQVSTKAQGVESNRKAGLQKNQKVQSLVPQSLEIRVVRQTQKKEEIPQIVVDKKEISPIKTVTSSISVEDLLIRKQQNEVQKLSTPQRPVTKQKYNSTIVEVKDQDTPDHSFRSDDPVQEEYVVQEYQTGSRYQGFKSGGMRNGRGRFYYQDGGYYQGQWKNNKMDGYGKLYYEGGKLAYEGQWSQDEFNGLGKVYNDNPVIFNSSFDYTNFDFLEDYWQYYEGNLIKDIKQGRGRIKLSNGEVFEGDFHEDKIQGFGKYLTLQGKTVEGIWRQSKLIKIINIS